MALAGAAGITASCQMFRVDNYDLPEETIQGRVIDVVTKQPVLTEQSSENGIRVRLRELSWGENVDNNPDLWCMPDGTFRNTKIFKGNYNVRVDGPFIPLYRETSDGTVVFNGTQTVDIKGVTDLTFEVQPFLRVKFVGEPSVREGVITATVVVERAVTREEFQSKIEEFSTYNAEMFNVTDVRLCVGTTPSVGMRARDTRWSSKLPVSTNDRDFTGAEFEPQIGVPFTITSNEPIPSGYTVFIRAAARINYATENNKRYNFSEVLDVMIP
jgi:hypothetical protein